MEEEEERTIWKSRSDSDTMLSTTVGRVMTTLLGARSRKLENAISHLSSTPKRASLVSLDDSLWFFHKYVRDAAEKKEPLDNILVPMIEHSLKFKELKYGCQTMVLLNWIFQDELLFQAVATDLANIIRKKDDRYIALGWCTLVRALLDYEITVNQNIKNGIREKYIDLLKIFCPCVSHLIFIVCNGSTLQDGYELPTRLSVAAADCILALTESLVKERLSSDLVKDRIKSSNQSVNLVSADIGQKKVKSAEISKNVVMESLLWNHLNELIILLQKLLAWSRKSRLLHAKGLEQVLKWLQALKESYGCFQDEAGSTNLKTGVLLLSSCWKHYGMLLHLEDHKFSQYFRELLDQYLSGIQFYTQNCTEKPAENNDSRIETRKFFLNCLSLLLGRLDNRQLESTISEYGLQISQMLVSQLHSADKDVIDGAVSIFKVVIFRMNSSSRSSISNTKQMDVVLPLLLNLLDERDGTARAVVVLIAEYCSISGDGHCLQEILKRLASGNMLQRRNAIDVISEIICMSSLSVNALSHSMWQDIANHLLERIEDEEIVIHAQASNLLPMIDPSLVLPALVHLVYSSVGRVQSHASDALMAVLKHHNEKHEVICLLLDCLSNLGQSGILPKASGDIGEGSKLDADCILRLIPEWSKSVKDWNVVIGPLIDKMFAEPSNATIVKFMSNINEHLAEAADVVLRRVLLHTKGQKEVDETFLSECESKTCRSADSVKLQQSLFERLCPLLIIRLLPLKVFNDVNSSIVYGQLLNEGIISDDEYCYISDECVSALLLNRAFCMYEFEDVRKLAAELCGRIHPLVLLPIISSQLDCATRSRDMLKIKACLFSVCTSLAVRGRDSMLHPVMLKIRKVMETILIWGSQDADEVSKAQHGCIDCLALMICAELQAPESFKCSTIIDKIRIDGNAAWKNSVISYVIHQLTCSKDELASMLELGSESKYEASRSLSFRLCMANVIISVCQKISDSGKKLLVQETLPHLIYRISVITDAEIRAACIQVLFSAVYHLKLAVLPYSHDLLQISLKSLRKGSEKERMAGAKLMASLMASEDAIVQCISGGLIEARSILSSLSISDPLISVRQVCKKLLECITL
ncbi:uncharacterized protein LOC131167378 isoform X2 [Malania oleifera]|uniref:uncharacterized protein LOC131167378 isoform X2 n=1 Tax=Malania oleifera TaxID=397392 RepID=UPI0025ADAE36|nr:uncharacterized protein LOC131167378 isoform X2 [Malania oleifera]